jgi:spore coat protein CotH
MKCAAPSASCTLALVLLAACGGGGGGGGTTSPSAAAEPPAATAPAGAPIFGQASLHEARLDMDRSAWEALRRNYLSNQWYSADFSVDGVAVRQVGVRSRGSGSRREDKPGLKVEYDKFVPAQEYYGYKSIDLDNFATDASMLRERLSFLVFEAMGIAAPRTSYARLTVNGEYWGLYGLVEPVSKPFLSARFGEKSGTLFDYEWDDDYDLSYLGPDAGHYVPLPFQPETNEDKPDVADGLLEFVRVINETPDAAFPAAAESWLDTTRFLTHLAVENALAERDGIAGDQGINNFYLYQYGGQKRFVFIPWDKDSTFASGSWPLYRNLERNVLARRLTADPAKRAIYADAVLRCVTSYVNPRWLTPQLESAWQQIRAAALNDPNKPFTNPDVEAAVEGLRGVIGAREPDVRAQR